jgi:hypothetical protein
MPAAWFNASSADLYDQATKTGRNGKSTANPARRDALFIEKVATYVIAVRPANPGIWAFYCHNDTHAVPGMFSLVLDKPKALHSLEGTWTWRSAAPCLSFSQGSIPLPGLPGGITGFLETSTNVALGAYGWPQMDTPSKLRRQAGRLVEKAFRA